MSSAPLKEQELKEARPEFDRPEFDRSGRSKTAANHSEKRLVVVGSGVQEENHFVRALSDHSFELRKTKVDTLQINVGKMCNLTCQHCHVEAGPNRTEIMTPSTFDQLFALAERLEIKTVDLTGGAPEMNPDFKNFVRGFRKVGCEVIVRSNLTILVEPGYEDYIDFFVEQGIHVIASLPCYTEGAVDAQRGDGVFDASIKALQLLNEAGYGRENGKLLLDLVYNPGGASLPAAQNELELSYKKELMKHFDVSFNSLYTITNLPIGRFYSDLKKQGTAEVYDQLLRDSFNPQTVSKLMCANTLNISWDGWVYDCDFNQMLELPMSREQKALHVCDLLESDEVEGLAIATGNHCFGCTAGTGSSCGGELV